jgi:hypothetical protein
VNLAPGAVSSGAGCFFMRQTAIRPAKIIAPTMLNTMVTASCALVREEELFIVDDDLPELLLPVCLSSLLSFVFHSLLIDSHQERAERRRKRWWGVVVDAVY